MIPITTITTITKPIARKMSDSTATPSSPYTNVTLAPTRVSPQYIIFITLCKDTILLRQVRDALTYACQWESDVLPLFGALCFELECKQFTMGRMHCASLERDEHNYRIWRTRQDRLAEQWRQEQQYTTLPIIRSAKELTSIVPKPDRLHAFFFDVPRRVPAKLLPRRLPRHRPSAFSKLPTEIIWKILANVVDWRTIADLTLDCFFTGRRLLVVHRVIKLFSFRLASLDHAFYAHMREVQTRWKEEARRVFNDAICQKTIRYGTALDDDYSEDVDWFPNEEFEDAAIACDTSDWSDVKGKDDEEIESLVHSLGLARVNTKREGVQFEELSPGKRRKQREEEKVAKEAAVAQCWVSIGAMIEKRRISGSRSSKL